MDITRPGQHLIFNHDVFVELLLHIFYCLLHVLELVLFKVFIFVIGSDFIYLCLANIIFVLFIYVVLFYVCVYIYMYAYLCMIHLFTYFYFYLFIVDFLDIYIYIHICIFFYLKLLLCEFYHF